MSEAEDFESKNHRGSDYRLTTVDGNPALEVPNGDTVVLRTSVSVESDGGRATGRRVATQTEIDSDDFAWFNVFPADQDEFPHPFVCIEPEVRDDE